MTAYRVINLTCDYCGYVFVPPKPRKLRINDIRKDSRAAGWETRWSQSRLMRDMCAECVRRQRGGDA